MFLNCLFINNYTKTLKKQRKSHFCFTKWLKKGNIPLQGISCEICCDCSRRRRLAKFGGCVPNISLLDRCFDKPSS